MQNPEKISIKSQDAYDTMHTKSGMFAYPPAAHHSAHHPTGAAFWPVSGSIRASGRPPAPSAPPEWHVEVLKASPLMKRTKRSTKVSRPALKCSVTR